MNTASTLAAALLAGSTLAAPAFADDDWWREAVFYEIFVRSFQDSTDGPLAGDGVGDFRGLIDRLDYLNDGDPDTDSDLGVTGIWLMPIMQSPSYHGYDVTDYRSIDDEYGTNEDFKAFTQAAEDRGIRVIVDLVLNHCSWEHPWFQKAVSDDPGERQKYRDWFVWRDEKPGWGDHMWHSEPGEQGGPYYFGFFWHGMPDLNVQNPDVRRATYDISRYWLEEMGTAGFRLDAIRHLIEVGSDLDSTEPTIEWIENYHDFLEGVDPSVFTVGEVWGDTEEVKQYIPDALHSAFEFSLAGAIVSTLADDAKDAADLRQRIGIVDESYPPNTVSTFLTNHDQNRVMSALGGPDDDGFARAKAAATILFTLPGVPFMYYGEEIGMTGTKPDPDIRTPMQWQPNQENAGFTTAQPWRAVNGDVYRVNVERQTTDPDSLLSRYRDLIRLRQANPAFSRGSVRTLETANPYVLAYLREEAGTEIVVVVNVGPRTTGQYALELEGLDARGRVKAEALLSDRVVQPMLVGPGGTARPWRPMVLAPYQAEIILLED